MKGRSRSKAVVVPQKARTRKSSREWIVRATAALLLIVFVTVLLRGNWPLALLVIGAGVGTWGFLDVRNRRRERTAVLEDVDRMEESRFLTYAADLLRSQGYTIHKPNRPLDSCADLLLTRGKTHFLCRLQRQSGSVARNVVTGTLAAMHVYGCTRAMVIANQRFTRSARSFARQNDCILIDRGGLANLVLQHRQGHRVIVFHCEEASRLRRRK
jgi:hypothetical protein